MQTLQNCAPTCPCRRRGMSVMPRVKPWARSKAGLEWILPWNMQRGWMGRSLWPSKRGVVWRTLATRGSRGMGSGLVIFVFVFVLFFLFFLFAGGGRVKESLFFVLFCFIFIISFHGRAQQR